MFFRADNAVKKRTELENTVSSNEEHIDALDKQLVESKLNLVASEAKYDDISRKLATLESDFARSNERAEIAEKKIVDIEEELRVVGQNLQTLEVGEEKTIQREEKYQSEIMDLRMKLKVRDGSVICILNVLCNGHRVCRMEASHLSDLLDTTIYQTKYRS